VGTARHSHKPTVGRLTPAGAAQRFQDRTGIPTVALFAAPRPQQPTAERRRTGYRHLLARSTGSGDEPPPVAPGLVRGDPRHQVEIIRWALETHDLDSVLDRSSVAARAEHRALLRASAMLRKAAGALATINTGIKPDADTCGPLLCGLDVAGCPAKLWRNERGGFDVGRAIRAIGELQRTFKDGARELDTFAHLYGSRPRCRPKAPTFSSFVRRCGYVTVGGKPIGAARIAWLCIAADVGADDDKLARDGSYTVRLMFERVRQVRRRLRRPAPSSGFG